MSHENVSEKSKSGSFDNKVGFRERGIHKEKRTTCKEDIIILGMRALKNRFSKVKTDKNERSKKHIQVYGWRLCSILSS